MTDPSIFRRKPYAFTAAGHARLCASNQARANTPTDYNTREVRQWARREGIPVPDRGRYLPKVVVQAWRAREEAS